MAIIRLFRRYKDSMKQLCLSIVVLLLLGCGGRREECVVADSVTCDSAVEPVQPTVVQYTATEQKLLALGFEDVQMLDTTIRVHLVYATSDNFLGRVMYDDLRRAFLLPLMAQKVVAAQQALHQERPDLDLLILDAVRPLSVQYKMFYVVAGTPKNRYVANPKKGPGMHNFGAAVDVTLVDRQGNWLPMGSDFDHFGPESHIDEEDRLLALGKITKEEYDNRRLLRRVMRQQGLLTLKSEWWHFSLMPVSRARRELKAVEL